MNSIFFLIHYIMHTFLKKGQTVKVVLYKYIQRFIDSKKQKNWITDCEMDFFIAGFQQQTPTQLFIFSRPLVEFWQQTYERQRYSG